MKLKYVVLLEILRIMVSVSQIIDAKLTYKSVLEVEKLRKTLTKNLNGLLIFWYQMKALVLEVLKLVPDHRMGKNPRCGVWSNIPTSSNLKTAERGFSGEYMRMYIWEDEIKLFKGELNIHTVVLRRKLVNYQLALYTKYRGRGKAQHVKLLRCPLYMTV